MDCDGSLDPIDLLLVSRPVIENSVDLVLGSRRPSSVVPPHARLANRLLALEMRRRFGLRLTDIGPMRCARRAELLSLGITDRRFGWPLEMVVRAAKQGWRVEEVPVTCWPRVGRSKVTGTLAGTLRTVKDMARVLS
jgi:hypothetical protein